ncbi:MAG: hypothetical protein V4617_21805 [Gemmatimonadota bacterium]
MRTSDFLAVTFPQETGKQYYAQITKIDASGRIECRFVHSGSKYTFRQHSGWFEVLETTGLFPVGTRTSEVVHYAQANEAIGADSTVGVTFDDGKPYVGRVVSNSPLRIKFLHSGKEYGFDANRIAQAPGNPYHGRKALEIKSYSKGRNLFSAASGARLSLAIKNRGKPMRGEFEVKLKRTDANEYLYENSGLRAEDSHASDSFDLRASDGQKLMLLIDFHPAVMPYQLNLNTSSVIDRDTTISGSHPFVVKSGSVMHFDVTVVNDTMTTTAASSVEAIQAVHREVTTNRSRTTSISLEGEASIELFGIVTLGGTGGGSTSTETGSGTSVGGSSSTGTTHETSVSYSVYFPTGLDIAERF